MMQEIRIETIGPHPKNPRKSLGDLTELSDSIKAFGVMQNLTLVPSVDGAHEYTVIIGHRRLAAAKLAGLETVPCQLVQLGEMEQIEAMLMENMQREDLTLIEEAEGFQMMLDLGKSIEDICRKTGLSETKVRHRIKLKELDQELLQQKVDGQVKINDLIKLEQIKDIEARNSVLAQIGTNNFEFFLERAIKEQAKEQFIKEITPKIPAEANEKSYVGAWDHSDIIRVRYASESRGIEDAIKFIEYGTKEGRTVDYSFEYSVFCAGYLKKKEDSEPSEEEIAAEEARKKEAERKGKLLGLNDSFKNLHIKFASECQETALKEKEQELKAGLIKYIQKSGSRSVSTDTLMKLLSLDECNGDGEIREAVETVSSQRLLLFELIARDNTTYYSGPLTFREIYNEDNNWKILLPILQTLGYQYSDEEQQFVNGTHPLFEEASND